MLRDYVNMEQMKNAIVLYLVYSDLDSADIANSKFIAKSPDDVATSALSNKIVLEVNYCTGGVLLK